MPRPEGVARPSASSLASFGPNLRLDWTRSGGAVLVTGADLEPSRCCQAELSRPAVRSLIFLGVLAVGLLLTTALAGFGTFGRHNAWLGVIGELPVAINQAIYLAAFRTLTPRQVTARCASTGGPPWGRRLDHPAGSRRLRRRPRSAGSERDLRHVRPRSWSHRLDLSRRGGHAVRRGAQ